MEQQPITQSVKHNYLLIGLIILLIVGSGVFVWQKRDWFRPSKPLKPQGVSTRFCSKKEDCGEDICQQDREKCVEIKYICENGICIFPPETIEFPSPPYKCMESKCEKEVIEDETANWKTYQFSIDNLYEEYSEGAIGEEWKQKLRKDIENQMESPPFKDCTFEIKYPRDWEVSRWPWPLHGYYPIPTGVSIRNDAGCQLDITMLAASEDMKEFVNDRRKENYSEEEVLINHYSVIKLINPSRTEIMYIFKNNETFCLPISHKLSEEKELESEKICESFYNQMLSTFRFLE